MALTNLPEFQSRPDRVQFAHAGAWENAWSPPLDRPWAEFDFLGAVGGAKEYAAEAFFGAAFFGIRFEGHRHRLATQLRDFAHAAQTAHEGADFFRRLIPSGVNAWGRQIDFAEIGAVNAWRSVEPVRIPWPPAEAPTASVIARLHASALGANRTHPKAVEFGCASPLPHWFGVPVSTGTPPHAIDTAALFDALARAARATEPDRA